MSADKSDVNGRAGVSSNGSLPDEAAPAGPELEPPDLPYAGFTWKEGGAILGVCVLITAIMLVSALTSPCCAPSSQAELMRGATARLSYLFLWALSAVPVFWACVRWRPEKVGWGRTLLGHLLLAFTIAFAVDLAQSNMYTFIASVWPTSDAPDLATGPLALLTSLQFLGELVPYLILLALGLGRYEYLQSRAQRKQAEQLERETERLRTQLTSARLEALRMQINPHFLFNTLHTVSTMAGHNPEGVRTATARLSDMLRYALSTSDQQEVPLAEELDVLESYLDIQKLRLDERLDVTLDVEPGVRQALVPTLLLQPLVENAVKHGFEGTDGTNHLRVCAHRDGDDLVVQVADDGCGLTDPSTLPTMTAATNGEAADADQHGLQNIATRLQGLYGDAADLTFTASDGGGLCVTIRLPFHTRETGRNLRLSAVVAE